MRLRKKSPILLCVDCQKGFYEENYQGGSINNKQWESVCGKVINKWRELTLKLVHVRYSATNIDSALHKNNPGFEFCDIAKPINNEVIITKNVSSAFIGTNLKELLDNNKHGAVIIIGLTTDHCISSTERMSSDYGYDTYVVSDATATFDKTSINGESISSKLLQSSTLASLEDQFATVIDSTRLFEIL